MCRNGTESSCVLFTQPHHPKHSLNLLISEGKQGVFSTWMSVSVAVHQGKTLLERFMIPIPKPVLFPLYH